MKGEAKYIKRRLTMIYFYFQGEYWLFKHYLFHVYACRFVPSVEFFTKYSIDLLSWSSEPQRAQSEVSSI